MRKILILVFMIQTMVFLTNAHAEKNTNLEIQVKSTNFSKLLGQ